MLGILSRTSVGSYLTPDARPNGFAFGMFGERSSSWIASFSQFLDNSRNVFLNCWVRAAAANSAQRAACLRHSLGSLA